MNTDHEFHWRQQMRQLRVEVQPARELWPHIAARIVVQSPRHGGVLRGFAGLAATLVVALGAGFLVQRAGWLAPRPAAPSVAAATPLTLAPQVAARAPLSWAVPRNPALAAAAQDLDDANVELQHALEQQPNAVFLVGLLNRSNAQRMRLLRTTYPG